VIAIMKRRTEQPALTARGRDILEAIVRLHIETGRAVSSGLVERALQRSVSSATIRAEMSSLETDGFLEQPHTSAGRLPTDAGFRVFVDGLRAGWALRRHEVPHELCDLVRRDIGRTLGAQDRLKVLAGLLSRMTDNISIIVGPSSALVRVERVEFYPRPGSRGLMVVILDSTQVRTGLVDLPAETPAHVVAEATRLLNDRVRGRTMAGIRSEVLDSIDLVRTPVTECAGRLARGGRSLLASPADGEIEVEGMAGMLAAPELHEPQPLRALLRFMESPRAIREALQHLQDQSRDGFGVWIGGENPVGELSAFSILTGDFAIEGRPGTVAVLGPRRMSYQRAFHGIDILRDALGRAQGAIVS
jgi:heat-inducible transcriptional repressor